MKDMEKEISNAASIDALAPIEGIKELIFTVRGVQVMMDRDLARLYQVETRVLNQAVKRNVNRFPERFMFQLTEDEWDNLKSQIVISNMSSQFVTTSLEKRPNRKVELDFAKHNEQCAPIVKVQLPLHVHDRFLIVDDQVYLLGASVKDMGKGLCAIARVGFSPDMVLGLVK